MKSYQKKMKKYKKLIQEQYVRDTSLQNVIQCSSDIILRQENTRLSYFAFLFEQSKYIKKKWWGLQGGVLILIWILLQNFNSKEYVERMLGILAATFVILIIPEIWKNRTYSAVEIERTSFYSLRQICAARTLLFAIVDWIMVMAFLIITYRTIPITVHEIVINFLIPFNVTSCICFRLLYSKWMDTEYTAVCISIIWIVIWLAIVTQNSLYHWIAEPVWIGFVLLSFGFLLYFMRKSWLNCEEIWEGSYQWN